MTSARAIDWPKGRGKLGVLDPLIGSWKANADSPMGPIECRRIFSRILNKTCVLLEVEWQLPGGKTYQEHAVYAADANLIAFWSFSSDGKRSQGVLAEARDIHPKAIAFEANMPAGTARMIYWPGDEVGFNFAVEAKSKKGWNRFTHHWYGPT